MLAQISTKNMFPAATPATLLDAANEFVARGWPVIPLVDKLPAVQWKEYQSRYPTKDECDAWFVQEKCGPTGIGIVTGRLSWLVVVDCDTRQDAEFWLAEHGSSPLVVESGGGGLHFYYVLPAGEPIRNRQRIAGRAIDIRGEGGYITAPPSLHPSGRRYEWQAYDACARLPVFDTAWLAAAHQERSMSHTTASARARDAVRYIHKIVAVAGEGGHNATFRAACKLRDAGVSPDEALAILAQWNETNASPPWSAQELAHKIRTAFQAANSRRLQA